MRPSKWTLPVIAAAEGGTPYTSEWIDDVGGTPEDPMSEADASVAPGGWSLDGAGTCANASSPDAPQILAGAVFPGTVYTEFSAVGVPDGTPYELRFFSLDGATPLGSSPGEWDQGTGEVCVPFFVDIENSIPGLIAVLAIGDVEVQNPVMFQ